MSNNRITPFVKRMRTNGGTIYTFSSAVEDIGLNINERNNVVKISHFALLEIPPINYDSFDLDRNFFNIKAIDGAFEYEADSASIKDGRVLIAESFENYALNLENVLLNRSSYDPTLIRTVSERVFWKWMKETGAIRWQPDVSTATKQYWSEETDADGSLGYNSVVKYLGPVSAGNVRTDSFGTYNETYVLVPTSHGQTDAYFELIEDSNYRHGLEIGDLGENILGRESYTLPHPDGLSYKAYYDFVNSSTSIASGYTLQYDNSTGSWTDGWWFTAEGVEPVSSDNAYLTDSSIYQTTGIYNVDLQYTGGSDNFAFRRSKVDCLSLVSSLDELKDIYGDTELTYDKMAIEYSIGDDFNFNAVLLYYTVWNSTEEEVLGRNLLGILFTDAPSGNSSLIGSSGIIIPSLEKIQSGVGGFGTSYSLRLNIKTDNMVDDTTATIVDQATSDQLYAEDWTAAFANLNTAVNLLTQNTGTVQYISEKYQEVQSTQTQILNDIQALQFQVNDIGRDIQGTANTVAMFADGDDPLVESSIYMKFGNVGIQTSDPKYPLEINGTTKADEIIIENAIRDTSGNILLGYGSPLQIGSSTNYRGVDIYIGENTPVIGIDSSSKILIEGDVSVRGSVHIDGSAVFTGSVTFDGSLNSPAFNFDATYFQPETQTGIGLTWDGNFLSLESDTSTLGIFYLNELLDVSAGNGTTMPAADGSVLTYDASSNLWTYSSIVSSLEGLQDTSIGTPTDGSILSWNATSSKWELDSIQTTIEGLSDTSIGTPTDGSILSWNATSSKWELDSIQTTIEGLSDTSIGTVNEGEFLLYDSASSKWIAKKNLVADILTADGSLILNDVPLGAPDSSEYLFVDLSDGNRIKRTIIFDASYLAFVGGVDNRIVTAGGPNSIQGEANLTFDTSTLGFDGSQDMFIQHKPYSDTSGYKNNTFYIKGSDALDTDPSSFTTITYVPTSFTPVPNGAWVHTPGTNYSYTGTPFGSYTVIGYGPTINTFFGNVGDAGGDLNISGGKGANASGGTDFNRGGTGGDLILNAGSGGAASGTGAVQGTKGNVHIDGAVINLDANYVDVADQIRLQGDPFTRIDFGSGSQIMSFHLRTGVAGNVEYMTLNGANPGPYEVVINEDGFVVDFRAESDAETHMLFVDSNVNKLQSEGADIIKAYETIVADNVGGSTSEITIFNNADVTNDRYVRNPGKKIYRIKFYFETSSATSYSYTFSIKKGTTTLDSFTAASVNSGERGVVEFTFGAVSSSNTESFNEYTKNGSATLMSDRNVAHGSSNGISLTVQNTSASSWNMNIKNMTFEVLDS